MQKTYPRKPYQANPLKMGRPMGAALALLGTGDAVPLMLGARGCATVGLVLLNRHFQRTLPIETVDMDELALIAGNTEGLERTLLELSHRPDRPGLVGLLVTGLAEARGDDIAGFLRGFRRNVQTLQPNCGAMVETLAIPCPDFRGASQDGWSDAVEAMVAQYAAPAPAGMRDPRQITVLAGWQMSPGDVEEIKDILEAFDLKPLVVPDLSLPPGTEEDSPANAYPHGDEAATSGPALLRRMGTSTHALAFGGHMRGAARILKQQAGIPFQVFDRCIGLGPSDALIGHLARISGNKTPARFRRQRSRLVDAMLNAAPILGRRKVVVASDPDHLFSLYCWLSELGAAMPCAIASTNAPILRQIPESLVHVGDLEDLEKGMRGADLLIAPSSAAPVARRLSIPHLRAGIPVTDRFRGAQETTLGYRGAWNLLCTAADLINDRRADEIPAES
ncbi:MAG: nitrogenase iron-molybdenum cofactor biosynthesis protein NifN [Desulfobulbus sp.]